MGVPWGFEVFRNDPTRDDFEPYVAFAHQVGGAVFSVPGPSRLYRFEHHWDFSRNPPSGDVTIVERDPIVVRGGGDGTYDWFACLSDGIELFMLDLPFDEYPEPLLGHYHRTGNIEALGRNAERALADPQATFLSPEEHAKAVPFFEAIAEAARFGARNGLILTVSY